MRTGARAFSALIAMSGLLASSTAAALLSLHLSFDPHHGEAADRHAADVAAMLHGHEHDDGTPEHDHVVTATSMSTAAQPTLAPCLLPAGNIADAATLRGSRWSARVAGDGQPRAGPSPLPFVLRI